MILHSLFFSCVFLIISCQFDFHYTDEYESMVSFVSRRYMRGENRKDSLMVCLSQIAFFVFQNNVIKAYRSVLLI